MHLGQGFILTNWNESMSTRIFQFVLGFVCFIQQFTLWQKTSKYINCTYGCNILGQLHYLKAQYAGSSKNVIWPGAEIILPAALAAEIQTYWKAQLFPEKSPLNGPLFLKSKPRFFLCRSPGWGLSGAEGWDLVRLCWEATRPRLSCPLRSPGDNLGPVSVPLRLLRWQ